MEDLLKQVLEKLSTIENKLDSFREAQEVTNKLLTGDSAGIKNQLKDISKEHRDFRRDVRDWQLSTSRRIDHLEEKISDLRDALQ